MSLDGINGQLIQTLVRGENSSKQLIRYSVSINSAQKRTTCKAGLTMDNKNILVP